MPPRPLIVLSLLFACFQLVSCQDCGPDDEPLLTLSVQANIPFQVDTVYGSGATGRLLNYSKQLAASRYAFFQLPLNLNADSTRYVLSIDGKQEAVTVFYQRKFYYKTRQCGYVFDLLSPVRDVRRQAQTTRGRVETVDYLQNSFNGGFLRTARSTTGIRLAITL